jgi:2-dehydro-3-deoxygluconokinase
MILCYGETLLRFVPQCDGHWIDDASIRTHVGGAELNTAFALANWGANVAYITALPDHYMGAEIIAYLEKNKIDTSRIIKKEGRLGSYYLTQGTDIQKGGLIYDRSHSSFSLLSKDDFDFDAIFKDIHWFHISAICPALNPTAADLSLTLLQAAKVRNITTSIDLNFRSRLWQYGISPTEIMPALVKNADVLMGNLWAAHSLLGVPTGLEDPNETDRNKLIEACTQSISMIKNQYPNVQTVAYTLRFDQEYYAVLVHDKEFFISNNYPIRKVIDKVGSGDTFMAAIIYGMDKQWKLSNTLDFAVKAAIKKLGELGDHTSSNIEDILNLK